MLQSHGIALSYGLERDSNVNSSGILISPLGWRYITFEVAVIPGEVKMERKLPHRPV